MISSDYHNHLHNNVDVIIILPEHDVIFLDYLNDLHKYVDDIFKLSEPFT